MIRAIILLALAAGLSAAPPCAAATADTTATPYSLLVPASGYETGCQGPCDCAVVEQPTYGSFELRPLGADPLYSNYAIERYIASFNNGPGAVSIVGSGHYKIGGEFALTQQMTLDLQAWGGPVQHFDSGVVPVNTPFPRIHVSCAAHGFACVDTVVEVDAEPIGAVSVPPPAARAGIQGVAPNPFGRTASIAIAIAGTGPVRVAVFDLNGRKVRSLAEWAGADAGPRTLVWDGRRDNGREAEAGVYWVRMQWPGGSDGRRLVKLD
jgi:hypothetical protein